MIKKAFSLPTPANLKSDLPASLALFIVAIPLCLGIAHASGAPLLAGLLAGIIGGIIVGLFSNSNLSVSGPAAGLTSVCAMAVATLGSYQGLVTSVLFAGLIQIVFGLARLGSVANYIPGAVIKGMLAAIGLTLIMKQFPHLIGYDSEEMGIEEFDIRQEDILPNYHEVPEAHENTLSHLLHSFKHLNYYVMAIGMISLAVLVIWEYLAGKKFKIIPGSLVAVLIATFMSMAFTSVFGNGIIEPDHYVTLPDISFTSGFTDHLVFPDFSFLGNSAFYRITFTIAIVASLESLLSIEAIEKLDPAHQRVDTNRELLAQGAGNLVSGLLGALPVTSVIVRGTVNISAGAASKYSTILHGFFILLALAFLVPVINSIPLSSLAAVLCFTGYKLIRPSLFIDLYKRSYTQFIPFVVTIVAIVFSDLLIGVLIGMVCSGFFIVRANYKAPVLRLYDLGLRKKMVLGETVSYLQKNKVVSMLEQIEPDTVLEIDGSRSLFIDPDVLDAINEFKAGCVNNGIELILVGIKEMDNKDEVKKQMEQSYSRLFENNRKWVDAKLLADPEYFQKLTKGQRPEYLFIGCSDSRVPANEITGTDPGEMFVHRNIANMVVNTDINLLSVLQYSVEVLNVKHVIVCGHYGCGGVKAAMESQPHGLIDKWLRNIKDVYRMNREEIDSIEDPEMRHRKMVEVNVREQVFNLMKTSFVQKNRELYGFPQVHGWVYDLSEGIIKDLNIDVDGSLDRHSIFKIM